MLDIRSARDRAVRLAVITGHMPNFDLIHARQRLEGFEACFGRCTSVCTQTWCRWHKECTELVNQEAAPRQTAAPSNMPALTFRDS